MAQDEEYSSGNQQIGPSYEEFLKESESTNSRTAVGCYLNIFLLKLNHLLIITEEKQKLKKLPPDRVGANFDHSSSTSAGWLPSFGRVWNNGRRWQSRYGSSARTPTHHPFGDLTLLSC